MTTLLIITSFNGLYLISRTKVCSINENHPYNYFLPMKIDCCWTFFKQLSYFYLKLFDLLQNASTREKIPCQSTYLSTVQSQYILCLFFFLHDGYQDFLKSVVAKVTTYCSIYCVNLDTIRLHIYFTCSTYSIQSLHTILNKTMQLQKLPTISIYLFIPYLKPTYQFQYFKH